MDIATLAMALAVLQEGSVRGAARRLDRAPSSVADGFDRLEQAVAVRLAQRVEGALAPTLAGEALLRSSAALLCGLAALASIAGEASGDGLRWAAHRPLPLAALATFDAVVRAGSIRRAARRLGLGQPHVSRQMARLEALLGRALLHRSGEGCAPTAEGLRLRDIAGPLVEAVAAMTAPAKKRFARDVHSVRFGTVAPIGHESRLASRLAGLVAQWRRERPGESLLVSSTTAEELMAGLLAGRFDVALTDAPMRHRRFESREMFSSELVLVGAKDVVAEGMPLRAMLASRSIAVPSLRSGLRQRIRDVLDPLLEREGSGEDALFEIDTLPILVNLVLDHGYLTVLPRDSVASLGHKIGFAALPGAPKLGFHLVWPRIVAAQAVASAIGVSLGERCNGGGPAP